MSEMLLGHCYCGEFKFSIPRDVSVNRAVYCHCESCRRAHSAPLYQIAYIDESDFSVVAGQELVKEFCKPGSNCVRFFCGKCGSRLYNTLKHRPGWLGVFPALLDEETQHNLPAKLKPEEHHLSVEAVLDLDTICDNLPRG
jgi:hypothetical protein